MEAKWVYLNRFVLRPLEERERKPLLLGVSWEPTPSLEENPHRLLARVANRVGGLAVPWKGGLLAWSPPHLREGEVGGLEGPYRFALRLEGEALLDPSRPEEREALSRLAQRRLEVGLAAAYGRGGSHEVEGSLLLGKEVRAGEGWRVRKGAYLRALVDGGGRMLLEVDIVHRILPTLTLEAWLDRYPAPRRVRSTYPAPSGRRQTWTLVAVEPGLSPEGVDLGGVSLLDYHVGRGRLREKGQAGRVVRVRDERGKEVYHLSGLLQPVLTLEDLAELGLEGALALQIPPSERFSLARKVAGHVASRVYGLRDPRPVEARGHLLSPPQLKALRGQRIAKPAEALRRGVLQGRPAKVGLLVVEGEPAWPAPLRKALLEVARASEVPLALAEPVAVARRDLLGLDLAAILERLSREAGVDALLVQTPPLSPEERNRLKRACLQRGLPSQFFNPPLEGHKLDNVLLGLVSKLGWRVMALDGAYPAELAVGFDAGADGSRSLRYGGAACAVTADGGLLSWLLPEAQRGERIHGEVVWGMLQEALVAFQRGAGRWPRHVLLLRDGKTQREEFTLALRELAKAGIGYDLVSVRKSGGGRIYPKEGERLRDGLYVPLPEAEGKTAFLLLTAYPGEGRMRATPRPLKVVHEEGSTPVRELARQLYHLSRLYPPSGYRFPSLPAPLHLADRLVREVGRVGLSSLQGLGREKLFFV
ncbi:Piwi domain-containing protein [Thermus arciformis]|uniref:Protein argonaute n=1 Tax=Thermus arciformis TaxID=482827 RepID=A0A1G7HX49_9DEIN|nr:argonaute PAZ domain-containing protein [Thermus arciformis]SDF04754.1 Piwi domain-containing protein [Thermus arciformis]